MRILVCSIEAPLPPTNGFRLYLSALLDGLSQRHEVRTVALVASDQSAGAELPSNVRLVPGARPRRLGELGAYGRSLLTRSPASARRSADALRDAVLEEVGAFRPDVVHVSSGRLARLASVVGSTPALLAALDAWHVNAETDALAASGLRRLGLRVQTRLVRRFEAREFRRFDRVVVVSQEDKDALLQLDAGLSVTVIPNGVDTAFFHPAPDRTRGLERITFTGVMDYTPNVDAAEYLARRVFPLVRANRPRAQLALVGRRPHPRVQALAGLEGIEVTGEVPDIRPWLQTSSAYACTMVSGTGIKNKLLEAMATGVACVATPLALQGMDVRPGEHVLVGERAEELAAQLEYLLDQPDAARKLGAAARDLVVLHHDWDGVIRRYEQAYEELVAERTAG